MTNISKRDFLKTVPVAVPATLLGGVSLPALAGEHQITINNVEGFYYIECPHELVANEPSREPVNASGNNLTQAVCDHIIGEDATEEQEAFCKRILDVSAAVAVTLLSYTVFGRAFRAVKVGILVYISLTG